MKEKAESLIVLLLVSSTNLEVKMNVTDDDDKHVQAYGRHAATSRLFPTEWSYKEQYYVIFVLRRTVPHKPHGIIRLPVCATPHISHTRPTDSDFLVQSTAPKINCAILLWYLRTLRQKPNQICDTIFPTSQKM